jgi:hypothetical protein
MLGKVVLVVLLVGALLVLYELHKWSGGWLP